MADVSGQVLGLDGDELASKSMPAGVKSGFGFAFRSARAGGFGGVGAVDARALFGREFRFFWHRLCGKRALRISALLPDLKVEGGNGGGR